MGRILCFESSLAIRSRKLSMVFVLTINLFCLLVLVIVNFIFFLKVCVLGRKNLCLCRSMTLGDGERAMDSLYLVGLSQHQSVFLLHADGILLYESRYVCNLVYGFG